MLADEGELRDLVVRLRRDYRRQDDFFARHALPEYEAVRSLELTPRERSLFYTFAVVPFHTHPSGKPKRELGRNGLWQVCATLRRQHTWPFDPERVVGKGADRLSGLLGRLDVMDDYDARWWHACAETLVGEFDGDPRTLLARHDYVAPHIARDLSRYSLPGLGDVLAAPFWLRTLNDQVHELSGTRWLAMPVDPAVFRVTRALGGLDLSYRDRDDRQLLVDFWTVFCERHGFSPIHVGKALRLVGLNWDRAGKRYVTARVERIRD